MHLVTTCSLCLRGEAVPLHGSGFRSAQGVHQWLIQALPFALWAARELQPTTKPVLHSEEENKLMCVSFFFSFLLAEAARKGNELPEAST